MKKRESFESSVAKGMSRNVCYVIIILLHHYPFLCYQSNSGAGIVECGVEFHLAYEPFKKLRQLRKYFNFYPPRYGMECNMIQKHKIWLA